LTSISLVTSDELATLGGHEGDVNCIVFSPDGRSFISVSNDWTVRVWDTFNSGSWYRNDDPEILHRWVNTIAFSDTSRVASGHGDSIVRVFSETADFSQIASLEGHTDQVRSITYSPDHKRIITGSDDGIILVWDAINFGQSLAKFEHDMGFGKIKALAVSPDGTRLASGAQSQYGQEVVVHIWDAIRFSKKPATLASEHDLSVFMKSGSLIHSLTFAADGNILVLGTEPGQLYAWKRDEERQDIAGRCSLFLLSLMI
jgi:WD40 repeat protein